MITTEQTRTIKEKTTKLFPNNVVHIHNVKGGYLLLVANNHDAGVFKSSFIDESTYTVFGADAFFNAIGQLIEQEDPPLVSSKVVRIMDDN